MKILWITNIVFPEAQMLLTGEGSLTSSGGWMVSAAKEILNTPSVSLVVAAVYKNVDQLTRLVVGKCVYYILPYGRGNEKINTDYIPFWKEIDTIEKPDVVHIHGTEYSHGLAYLDACGSKNVVISIQGLLTECSVYYRANLSVGAIVRNLTVHDLLVGGVLRRQKEFERRGGYEREMIGRVDHVIGRTYWDKSLVKSIHPGIHYYSCNETLRPEFYDGIWEYDRCIPHSIFVSQASIPLKGLHILLESLNLVRKEFPDVKVRIAGHDLTRKKSFQDLKRFTGYGRYIRRFLHRNNLTNTVSFLGPLNAEKMREEFLSANVFVLPSSIENSPNSLGEAQLLGVPCIASYVGGVPDMISDKSCGYLYRFEDYRMLACRICNVFQESSSFDNTEMRRVAYQRHSPEINRDTLFDIYLSIIKMVEK